MNQVSASQDYPTITPDRYDEIRDILLEKSPDEIGRELSGLIETISTKSLSTAETVRFVMGVSFTKKGTCFDYWINRIVLPDNQDSQRVVVEKEAINRNHRYVRFCYPPDPQFDANNLRGALIATVENNVRSHEQHGETDTPSGILTRALHAITGSS